MYTHRRTLPPLDLQVIGSNKFGALEVENPFTVFSRAPITVPEPYPATFLLVPVPCPIPEALVDPVPEVGKRTMGIAPPEVIAEPAYLAVQRGDELDDREVARMFQDDLDLVQEGVEPVPARVVSEFLGGTILPEEAPEMEPEEIESLRYVNHVGFNLVKLKPHPAKKCLYLGDHVCLQDGTRGGEHDEIIGIPE
jgi:hypothetical protein